MGEKLIGYWWEARGKETTRKTKTRWVDNITMDHVEVGWGDVDWIGMAQDSDRWRALANAVMNLRVPYNAGKLLSGYTIGDLTSSSQFHRVSYQAVRKCCNIMIHNELISLVLVVLIPLC
jgi:hypothetical protein